MDLKVGDRLGDETGEWETIGRPYTTASGKNARVRVQRVGDPAVTELRTWAAHEKVSVKRSRRGGQAMMTPLRVLLAAVVLAGCASIPYDARDPSATIYISVSPGGFGSTPMGRRVEWTWQHRSVDNARFVRDNEICNAASKTNTATMMLGGDPPIRLYEDCMARLGYQLLHKYASGDPVSRGWGRGIE